MASKTNQITRNTNKKTIRGSDLLALRAMTHFSFEIACLTSPAALYTFSATVGQQHLTHKLQELETMK